MAFLAAAINAKERRFFFSPRFLDFLNLERNCQLFPPPPAVCFSNRGNLQNGNVDNADIFHGK